MSLPPALSLVLHDPWTACFQEWCLDLWHSGARHGTKLAETLGEPRNGRAGDVDCAASTDRMLAAAEREGWLVRGKMELTPTRRSVGRGHAGAAYPIDHCWMPNRASEDLFDFCFPEMPADRRAACAAQYGWPVRASAPAPAPIAPPTKPTRPKDPMPPTAPKPTAPPMLNVTISRSALLPALRAAEGVSASNAPIRAYACVHLLASPSGFLTLRATNGQQAISRDVAATVKAPGFALLDASDLLRRVEAMADGPVTLTERQGKVEMRAGAGRYTLPITAASEAPAIPSSAPEGHEVDAAAFAALLDRLAPTMHDSPLEVTSHAVNLVGDGATLKAQAFNGPSAGEASLTFDGDLAAIVPGSAVRQLVKVLKGLDGTVQLATKERRLFVFGPLGLAYSTLLSEGPFPPVGSLWRPAAGPFLRVGRKAMRTALDAIRFDLHHDRVRLRPTGAGVTVHGLTQDGAEASSDVSAACSLESLSVTWAHLARLLDFFGEEETVTLWSAVGDRREGGMPGPLLAEVGTSRYLAMPLLFDAIDLASPADEEEAA